MKVANMGYGWNNWFQEVSYNWKGWAKNFAYRPRWTNPTSDIVGPQYQITDQVTDSVPVEWPEEYQDLNLWVGPVGQAKIWGGSLTGSGPPVQRVDHRYSRMFVIDNKYGGDLWRDGKFVEYLKPGQQWDVLVPQPVRLHEDGWAVEGYPNLTNQGDRHWYGIEDDGTAHESIWCVAKEHIQGTFFGGWQGDTMLDYCSYAPDGTLITGIVKNGKAGVIKGNVQWTSLAWNRGDSPHRLGAVFHDLAKVGVNGAASDGTREDWASPAYGQLFRLAPDVYENLSRNADDEQQAFLDSLFHYGLMPYDTGGHDWGVSVAQVAGAQHVGSSIPGLDIKVADLELVTSN